MKITISWRKCVATALLAAGIWMPSVVRAASIPLGDPSFEDYAIDSVGNQYAYADAYRPTSAWIDDQDGIGGGNQDDVVSNWIYTTAYANSEPLRGSPRTGNQALHGFFEYSSQVTSAVFEAGKTYTFSAFAQGDDNAVLNAGNWESRVWLYIFDGNKPFTEANSLIFQRFSPTDSINTGPDNFVNRDPNWDATQSQQAWQQISISWTVQPGAPEIGHLIAVGFFIGVDGAVDDAALTYTTTPGKPGDFDGDGDVDGADFVAWQTHYPLASGATLANGDADADGDVDGADFAVWQSSFSGSPVSTVPEPGSIVLFVGSLVGLVGVRKLAAKSL